FTPKQVETRSEREKLMFRVKLTVPPERILAYIERVKTGIRGVGYVRLDDATPWPERLDRQLPALRAAEAEATPSRPAGTDDPKPSAAPPEGSIPAPRTDDKETAPPATSATPPKS